MRLIKIKWLLITFIVLLLIDCACGAFIGWWRGWFWASVEHKELLNFVKYLIEFTVVALIDCLVVGYQQYLGSVIALSMRTKLTRKALKLNRHHEIEGGSQRVQDDCNTYPTLLISLLGGLCRSVIMILSFGIILMIQVSKWYLLIPLFYSLLGTFIASKIAKPLIHLNYINQMIEAKFRHILQKIQQLNRKTVYAQVHRNNYNLFKVTKYLSYFQSFYNQITIIVPCIIYAGLYFSTKITFGIFMQVSSATTEMINNLSFLINSFGEINLFISCRRRLKEASIL